MMCQKFIERPSARDIVHLAILGPGRLELNLTEGKAVHNDHAIEPLPFSADWNSWVGARMAELNIPADELKRASLIVNYTVELSRSRGVGWLCATYDFECVGLVEAQDRAYTSNRKGHKEWGLSCI